MLDDVNTELVIKGRKGEAVMKDGKETWQRENEFLTLGHRKGC